MPKNTKGPTPPRSAPSSHRPHSKAKGTDTTPPRVSVNPVDLPEYASLSVLQSRLIPLCQPSDEYQPGGCTYPPHNRKEPCNAPGKRPLDRGWTSNSYSPQWPRNSFNVGIRCGDELAVLDIDPRAGGTELLSALESTYRRIPSAPEVLTGGGGRHLYTRAKPGQISWKLPGVELKAAGSQVVAVGSLHPSGQKYDWAAGHTPSDIDLPPLPEWLETPPQVKEPRLKAVPTLEEPDPRSKIWKGDSLTWEGIEYDREELINRAKLYIQAMPLSVSGQGGHDVAFRVSVALVRGFLLPERDSRNILALWNEKMAKPKWSKGELEHKLSQAAEKVREKHFRWGYLLKGEPNWPEIETESQQSEDQAAETEEKTRTIDPRLVYIAAVDQFMWFSEGVNTPGISHWQSYFNQSGATAMLQNAGYSFKKASTYIKEKRCHLVKDFSGHVPTNQRIIKGPDGKDYLNLPSHLIPEATPGPTPLLDELVHAIAGDDSEAEQWLWNWAAYIVQYPDDLPGVCVVVRGPQGVGKSKLGEAIGHCRGGYVTVSNSVFKEQFNSKWADARFVAAAEIMLADARKEHNDRFKAWITDPTIEYHRKNRPEFNIPNRIAWWLTSNDDNPVVVPVGDRRFSILESVAPSKVTKLALIQCWRAFDRREHEWPELQAFRHKLLTYKVNIAKARAPLLNKVHQEHQEASQNSVESFVAELKLNGWRPLAARYGFSGTTSTDGIRPGQIGVDGAFIYRIYQLWVKEQGMGVYGASRFYHSSAMRTAFQQTGQRRIRGIQYRLWILPIGVDPDADDE